MLEAINPWHAPVEMVLYVARLNIHKHWLMPANSREVIRPLYQMKLSPEDVMSHWVISDPSASVEDVLYRPPLPPSRYFTITQAFDGPFSHNHEPSRYAVDIAMPVGTPVHAARDGVVVAVRDDYVIGRARRYFLDKANYIRILHADGTLAMYAHLLPGGVEVRPGEHVRAGRRIARSGSTGYSTGPHLHFVIQRNAGMKLVSVPFRFRAPDGKAFVPQPRMRIRGG